MPIPKDPIRAQLWRERQRISQIGVSRNSGENNPMYGTTLSEERKKIISQRMSGKNNPNFGKERPDYVKEAVSKAHKGKPSPFKGKIHTEEFKEMISKRNKGNKYHLGKNHSDKTRELISKRTKECTDYRGDKHIHWKGGVTPENVMARHTFEYKELIKKAFKRDNFACIICGNNNKKELQIHHIKQFTKNPNHRYKLSNVITVCKDCHPNLDKI